MNCYIASLTHLRIAKMFNANKNGNKEEESDESGLGWISWFCDLEGHEFFIEVPTIFVNQNLGGR